MDTNELNLSEQEMSIQEKVAAKRARDARKKMLTDKLKGQPVAKPAKEKAAKPLVGEWLTKGDRVGRIDEAIYYGYYRIRWYEGGEALPGSEIYHLEQLRECMIYTADEMVAKRS